MRTKESTFLFKMQIKMYSFLFQMETMLAALAIHRASRRYKMQDAGCMAFRADPMLAALAMQDTG